MLRLPILLLLSSGAISIQGWHLGRLKSYGDDNDYGEERVTVERIRDELLAEGYPKAAMAAAAAAEATMSITKSIVEDFSETLGISVAEAVGRIVADRSSWRPRENTRRTNGNFNSNTNTNIIGQDNYKKTDPDFSELEGRLAGYLGYVGENREPSDYRRVPRVNPYDRRGEDFRAPVDEYDRSGDRGPRYPMITYRDEEEEVEEKVTSGENGESVPESENTANTEIPPQEAASQEAQRRSSAEPNGIGDSLSGADRRFFSNNANANANSNTNTFRRGIWIHQAPFAYRRNYNANANANSNNNTFRRNINSNANANSNNNTFRRNINSNANANSNNNTFRRNINSNANANSNTNTFRRNINSNANANSNTNTFER